MFWRLLPFCRSLSTTSYSHYKIRIRDLWVKLCSGTLQALLRKRPLQTPGAHQWYHKLFFFFLQSSNLLSINLDERVDNVNKQDDCCYTGSLSLPPTQCDTMEHCQLTSHTQKAQLLYFQHSIWGMALACWLSGSALLLINMWIEAFFLVLFLLFVVMFVFPLALLFVTI